MLNAEREREMIMRVKGKGKSRVTKGKGKLISRLAIICALLFVVSMGVSFAKYPERYLTTWKYQLENDLAKGNPEAIEYYNNTYIANGKQLFGDKYIVEDVYLNLATVIGSESSDDGVLLLTNDGNGYYIEK